MVEDRLQMVTYLKGDPPRPSCSNNINNINTYSTDCTFTEESQFQISHKALFSHKQACNIIGFYCCTEKLFKDFVHRHKWNVLTEQHLWTIYHMASIQHSGIVCMLEANGTRVQESFGLVSAAYVNKTDHVFSYFAIRAPLQVFMQQVSSVESSSAFLKNSGQSYAPLLLFSF